MVQGKINSKKKEKKEAPKRKAAPILKKEEIDDKTSKDYIYNEINKHAKHHKKKIYKSIEQTIIDKAKHGRERFVIL